MSNAGHLTAGDIGRISRYQESSYGQPTSNQLTVGYIKGDGGSFTPTDNPQQYVSWRSGNRSYSSHNLVAQNHEAGYTAIMEVAMTSDGPLNMIGDALGTIHGTEAVGGLPSKTTQLTVRTPGTNDLTVIKYVGCKTDRLVIKADQPGGIVEFQETVMASYGYTKSTTTPGYDFLDGTPAAQWINGVTVNGTAVYPQNFELTINNNLGRVKGMVTAAEDSPWPGVPIPATVNIVEGRREMEFSMDVWMADLTRLKEAQDFGIIPANKTIALSLQSGNDYSHRRQLTLTAQPLLDGNNHALVQDKQMETLRYRVSAIQVGAPSANSPTASSTQA